MTERDSVNPFKDDMTGRLLLGKYRIVRRLATGGMGVVYLARLEGAAGFVKPVVVKLILPLLAANTEFSGMFAREAKLLANLQHPGIVSAIDFAEEQDFNVMVLEYVHGFQLGEWRRFLASQNKKIPTNVVIQIMINVLDALHYAHTLKNHQGEPMKIIHRDISPSNIMLDTDGHVKLVDFGIAFSEKAEGEYQTTNRSFKGKLPYSAPELFASQKASVRSDVYAAGVTLHEVLFGRNEFNLKDHASVIQAVLNHVPTSIHAVRDDAPDRIDEIIWKAVAKKPEHRFKSAAEFATALREICTVPEHRSLSQLNDLVQLDFAKEMSKFLGVESLTSRERAWRSPSLMPEEGDTEVEPQPEVVNTLNLSAKTRTRPEVTTVGDREDIEQRKPMMLGIAGLVVLLAVGAAVYFAMNRSKGEERRFLLVQNTVPDSPDNAPAAVDTGQPQAEEETAEPEKQLSTGDSKAGADETAEPEIQKKSQQKRIKKIKTVTETDGKPDPQALTAAFKKRKGAVHNCFQRYPDDMKGGAKASVLFHLETSGKVKSAELSPPAMRGTPLGKCLIDVSTSTRFPKQNEPVSFRIPLSASRVRK